MSFVVKMNPMTMIAGRRRRSTTPRRSLVVSKTIKVNLMATSTSRRSVTVTVTVPPLVVSALVVFLSTSPYTCSLASASTTSEAAFVKKTVSSHDIVIFSKSYCPYCKQAKAVFKELNQSPHVIELDERDDGWSLQDALNEIVGRRTVPQVFVNGKHIGGSDDTVEAYESGELAKLLGVTKADL